MRIVVLAGGLSPERDVSLSSGTLIANALLGRGHEVLLLDLYRGTLGSGEPEFLTQKAGRSYAFTVPESEPDLERLQDESGLGPVPVGPGVLEICRTAEVVFLALHGAVGENGQLQALLDLHGIRYTGSGFLGCSLAMDKDVAKRLMVSAGIPTAEWVSFRLDDEVPDLTAVGFPCVVKPLSCGSSIGISLVQDRSGLETALRAVRPYEDRVLVERMIAGREFSCAVLDGRALPVIEIVPKEGFYDYRNKYQAGRTEELCPAPLGPGDTRRIQETALAVHRLLRLGFYSRTDFLLDAGGGLFCLEANTLPGMTPTSLLPQEAAAAGIPYPDLCEAIVRSAAGGALPGEARPC